jgi:hypothetical protein
MKLGEQPDDLQPSDAKQFAQASFEECTARCQWEPHAPVLMRG